MKSSKNRDFIGYVCFFGILSTYYIPVSIAKLITTPIRYMDRAAANMICSLSKKSR